MKILYSSWFGPKKSSVNRSSIKMGALSNFFLQRAGYETIFVGDQASIDAYKNVKFNQVLKMPNIINDVPKCMWSAGKLLALSLIEEPVIHVDFDLFFIEPPKKEKLNNDIICLHNENYNIDLWDKFYNEKFKDIKPKGTEKMSPTSYNAGIIGGLNIKLIRECINELIQHIILHKEKIIKIQKSPDSPSFMSAVTLEQIWFFQLYLAKANKRVPFCYLDSKNSDEIKIDSAKENFIHFWGEKSEKYTNKTVDNLYSLYLE